MQCSINFSTPSPFYSCFHVPGKLVPKKKGSLSTNSSARTKSEPDFNGSCAVAPAVHAPKEAVLLPLGQVQ